MSYRRVSHSTLLAVATFFCSETKHFVSFIKWDRKFYSSFRKVSKAYLIKNFSSKRTLSYPPLQIQRAIELVYWWYSQSLCHSNITFQRAYLSYSAVEINLRTFNYTTVYLHASSRVDCIRKLTLLQTWRWSAKKSMLSQIRWRGAQKKLLRSAYRAKDLRAHQVIK